VTPARAIGHGDQGALAPDLAARAIEGQVSRDAEQPRPRLGPAESRGGGEGGHEGRLDHVVDLGVVAGAQVGDEPMHDVDVALEQEPTRGAITGGAGRDQPGVAQRLVGRGAQGDELAAALTHSGVATPTASQSQRLSLAKSVASCRVSPSVSRAVVASPRTNPSQRPPR
jgi:hypothetical protein